MSTVSVVYLVDIQVECLFKLRNLGPLLVSYTDRDVNETRAAGVKFIGFLRMKLNECCGSMLSIEKTGNLMPLWYHVLFSCLQGVCEKP